MSETHYKYCWRDHEQCYRKWCQKMDDAGWFIAQTLDINMPRQWQHKKGWILTHSEVEKFWVSGITPPPF